jgi:uncharacterized delta-60 repeat protein
MALNFKKIWNGLKLVKKAATTSDSSGDLEVVTVLGKDKLHYYDAGESTPNSAIVTETHSAVLQNKSFLNTAFDAEGTGNTLSNIKNSNIKAAAAIDASKIANGTVSNTSFQYVSGATSNIQSQLDSKANQTALDAKANTSDVYIKTESDANFEPKNSNIQSHISNISNPHSVTKSQVGLSNVPNVDATSRANHTGTQLASTISDFNEAVDDRTANLLVPGTNVTLAYNDLANTLTISATGGGGGGSSDYLIDEMISKTSTNTSASGIIYKRVQSPTSLTSFNSIMVNEGTPTSGNLTIDIKVGAVPYTLSARFNGTINSMAVQADGKVILVGSFTTYNLKSVGRNIIRLNTDGTVDPTFVVGTGFNSGSFVNVVKILSDGSVLVGGAFTSYNGATLRGLCKLSSLGVLDTAFTSGTRGLNVGGEIKDIQVRSSGKILLLGNYTTSGYPVTAKGLIQLNTDGSYDSSFEAGNLFTASYTFFQGLLLSDDSLFVVGYFGEYDLLSGAAYTVGGIIKLTPSGIQDPTFTTPGVTGSNVNTIALHQGDIVLGGAFSTTAFGGGLSASRIVKLNSTTGAVIGPPTFSPPTGLAEIVKIIVATDDTIFVSPLTGNMYKLNADGTSDATFTSTLSTVKSFAFASNGNLLVGGAFSTNNTRILPSTGAFDITYDTMISIFDNPPSFNFASLADGDILNGTIARAYIPAGYYVKVDITAVPATYIGSFYITLY